MQTPITSTNHPHATTTTTTTTRQISCKRCQKRKIKCSRTFPSCINCSTLQLPCEYRDDGSRRFPVSRDYVASLEARVASLERYIAKLGVVDITASVGKQQDNSTWSMDGGIHSGVPTSMSPATESHHHDLHGGASLLPGRDDQDKTTASHQLIYHGPTSIYSGAFTTTLDSSSDDDDVDDKHDIRQTTDNTVTSSRDTNKGTTLTTLGLSLDAGERCISECIALFFHWQYPQFMFIDREAFILDFRSGALGGSSSFCSVPLVNAVCSIGALVSENRETRRAAVEFAARARELLLGGGGGGGGTKGGKRPLPTPHVTAVQALLCCGFYEIGLGNFSDGWLYSGMAFRMGQDLGFQRDPDTWTKRAPDELDADHDVELEKEFRRRIYWGCYISDKFFSLFLGRPCFLHELDADVKPSRPKPQAPIFNNWLVDCNLGHLRDQVPLVPKLTLVFHKQIEIGTLIREGLSMVYSPRAQQYDRNSGNSNISLSGINAKLSRFRDQLPPEMRIKEWTSLAEPVQPHLAVMHVLYHSALISLNRPFLNQSRATVTTLPPLRPVVETEQSHFSTGDVSSPATICTQSAERLLQILKRFRTQHGLRHAPLVLVHGTISAISALLAVHVSKVASTAGEAGTRMRRNDSHSLTLVREFADLLRDYEDTWVIARKARRKTGEIIARLECGDPGHSRVGREGGDVCSSTRTKVVGVAHDTRIQSVTEKARMDVMGLPVEVGNNNVKYGGLAAPSGGRTTGTVGEDKLPSLGALYGHTQMDDVWFTENNIKNGDDNQHHEQRQPYRRSPKQKTPQEYTDHIAQYADNSSYIPQASHDIRWLEDILLLPDYSMDIMNSPYASSSTGKQGWGFP